MRVYKAIDLTGQTVAMRVITLERDGAVGFGVTRAGHIMRGQGHRPLFWRTETAAAEFARAEADRINHATARMFRRPHLVAQAIAGAW